jgi:Ca2+:H+ antiporter
MLTKILLAFIPVSLVLAYVVHAPQAWVFLTALLAIIPLADLVRQATEEIAKRTGSGIGGLLNVTFGNAPELVLALFVLKAGEASVAKAQITGSIIGNSLLGLGLAAFLGGLKKPEQQFGKARAGLLSSMLVLSLVGLLVPAAFDFTERSMRPGAVDWLDERLSLAVSCVLLLMYGANMLYVLVTHRGLFRRDDQDHGTPSWPLWKGLALLLVATILVAIESELVSGGLEAASTQLGLSKFFLGITVLAVVGNAAEYTSAIYFARKDRMDLVMSITVGSSIQVALMVAPVLVIASFFMGHWMTLVFTSPLELIAVAAAAFSVNAISHDGETTWFEGALLLAVYLILCMAFYFVQPGAHHAIPG